MHLTLLLAILLCSPVVCPGPQVPSRAEHVQQIRIAAQNSKIQPHARGILDQLKLIVPKLTLPERIGSRFYVTVDEDDIHSAVPLSDVRSFNLFCETVLANGDGSCNDAGWDALRRVCYMSDYRPIVLYLGKGRGYQIRLYTDGLLICIQQENPFK